MPSSPTHHNKTHTTENTFRGLLAALDAMIQHQEDKTLQIASQAIPHITHDDLLNPHDFTALQNHALFNYEDGITTGLKTARALLQRELRVLQTL